MSDGASHLDAMFDKYMISATNAFALGVFYAYWLEKSRSVLAPAIGHNAGDVVEYLILFIWVARSGG
jgi:divalent metal cation (Fe/Co/Zn/Cd) transporter